MPNIKFDASENWDNQAGDPPGDKYDALGVATHEFGHFTELKGPFSNGHLDPDAHVCTNSPKRTMCPTIPLGA